MAIDCANIQRTLEKLGISTDQPDFLNNTRWINYVGEHPELLETVAAFVSCREYSREYLESSERIIRIAAEALYSEIQSDGRQGACIDASGVLSQVLEKESIWCFQASGSLTAEFPPDSGIEPLYFYAKDIGKEFVAAHSWVVAPPFKIVDVTIKAQAYRDEVQNYLPEVVLAKEVEAANFGLKDYCSPRFLREAERNGVSELQLRLNAAAGLRNFHSTVPVVSVATDEGAKLKYIPNGIKAFDGPLEENASLHLNGRSGMAIYEEVIKPNLD
jgi:hypothetical protein